MRVKNSQSELIFLSADQLQELTSLLLHQAKSPLVATAGFVEMVDLSGKTSKAVNDKLLGYAQKSTQRALKLVDMIEAIATLNTATPDVKIAPIRLDSVIDGVFRDEMQVAGMKRLKYKLLRSYKLPLVLADRSRLKTVLHQLGDIFSQHAGRSEVVEISFRIRGDYEVIRFLAPSLDRVLAIAKPVFLKKLALLTWQQKGIANWSCKVLLSAVRLN